MEYQLGNIPEQKPAYQSSLYDMLDLSYRYKSFGLDTRIEQYYPSFGEDISYTRVSQFKFSYRSDILDVELGNVYASFGRGLLMRTYEIPGSIWETRGYRVRYGFYKDLLGGAVKLKYKNAELKLIRGEVLDVTLPPTIADDVNRRPDLIEGVQASYRMGQQNLGLIYMRHHTESQSNPDADPAKYLSIYYDGMVLDKVSIYGEMAKKVGDGTDMTDFSESSAYAGYLGINFYLGNFGVSLEYKNYHNFSLGTGINDPPTLVKEQSYRLLNRSTHIPILTDESGYQLEIYYTQENGNIWTFNTSRAENQISPDDEPVFQEYFGEYQFSVGDQLSSKIFVDYAIDPFDNEDHRYAAGTNLDLAHEKMASTLEFEWQYIERLNDQFSNLYLAYTLAKPSKYSASLLIEWTADPIQLASDSDPFNYYPAFVGSYRPNAKNILTLFAGKRRGGPACNSGVCYNVLDFEGIELRLNTRF
ncbi:DUF6029 family protein [Reichenbachiella sp. 5M10]|uniref:DUF6029 family protein n=1 Tax=Reichenbachiella sp. 5M10 TaxID=1889772 RepID=UPI0011798DB9